MTVTFAVAIDWDVDGSFATAGDNITAYVRSVKSSMGIRQDRPEARVASIGQCTLVVDNGTQEFSPLNSGGTYYGKLLPNRPVKITATSGGDTWTLFRGYTRAIIPDPGEGRNARARIVCEDALGWLYRANIVLPLQQNETGGTIITKILAEVFGGATASGTYTFTGTVADGDTAVINGQTYTFKDALTGGDTEVLIGTEGNPTPQNLANAVNQGEGIGTLYDADITRNTDVTAEAQNAYGQDNATNTLALGLNPGGTDWVSQEILVDDDLPVSSVWLYIARVNAPSFDLDCGIYDAYTGGSLIDANATFTVTSGDVGTSAAWVEFNFAATITIPKGQSVWLRLDPDGSHATDYYSWSRIATQALDIDVWYFSYTAGIPQIGAYNMTFWFEGTVTIRANAKGTWGNAITTTESSSAITVSGGTLSGGTDAPSGLIAIDTGQNAFPYAGDQWRERETNAFQCVQDVTAAEVGFFWVARDGTITWQDKNWFFALANTAATLTLTDGTQGVDISGALTLDAVNNRVTVTFAPRITESTGVIARAGNTVRVRGKSGVDRWSPEVEYDDETTVLRLPFIEVGTGTITGATNVILPVPTTDYTVFEFEDGSGVDYTTLGYLTMSMIVSASGIELTFKNTATGDLFVFDLQVRGTALISRDVQEIIRQDDTSIAAYGQMDYTYQLPFYSTQGFSELVAEYILQRHKDPVYRLDSVTIQSEQPYTMGGVNLFSLEIGDVLAISEGQTGLSGRKYAITGIDMQIPDAGGRKATFTYFLRDLQDTTYWLLGVVGFSELGETTILAL